MGPGDGCFKVGAHAYGVFVAMGTHRACQIVWRLDRVIEGVSRPIVRNFESVFGGLAREGRRWGGGGDVGVAFGTLYIACVICCELFLLIFLGAYC